MNTETPIQTGTSTLRVRLLLLFQRTLTSTAPNNVSTIIIVIKTNEIILFQQYELVTCY